MGALLQDNVHNVLK